MVSTHCSRLVSGISYSSRIFADDFPGYRFDTAATREAVVEKIESPEGLRCLLWYTSSTWQVRTILLRSRACVPKYIAIVRHPVLGPNLPVVPLCHRWYVYSCYQQQ